MSSKRAAVMFGNFNVTSQVFYQSQKSFGLVNLKPILPGHVLVCPLRRVSRISGLTGEEAADFYATVQKISLAIEKYYHADGLNISIQDGPLAGQSVPHVHCHIIPRKLDDLPNIDDIYRLLDSKPGDLDHVFNVIRENRRTEALGVDSEQRPPREMEDMEAEAKALADFLATQQES
ncbi:Hnt2p [Sugiyamaella lignohabitans]|uniref:Bis(5'-adenosyl)-triphosphatase n=1 Tax=Sugiyamaella lignohabitans TaxID=796027 RepID=A0A167DWE9_9ASCO|nr:Hnt2p [Sugiyamaella lignohabitans]ANB13376.1 Hnt2p [Sugiyamaella lignohabitans]